MDNLLFQLHKNGLIVIDTGDMLNTSLTVSLAKLGAGGNWEGFDSNAPCKLVLTSLDPYPELMLHDKEKTAFTSNFSTALHCKREKEENATYEYCFTLDTEIDFTAAIAVNEDIKLVMTIDDLTIAIKGVIDSARGRISYWLI